MPFEADHRPSSQTSFRHIRVCSAAGSPGLRATCPDTRSQEYGPDFVIRKNNSREEQVAEATFHCAPIYLGASLASMAASSPMAVKTMTSNRMSVFIAVETGKK